MSAIINAIVFLLSEKAREDNPGTIQRARRLTEDVLDEAKAVVATGKDVKDLVDGANEIAAALLNDKQLKLSIGALDSIGLAEKIAKSVHDKSK